MVLNRHRIYKAEGMRMKKHAIISASFFIKSGGKTNERNEENSSDYRRSQRHQRLIRLTGVSE